MNNGNYSVPTQQIVVTTFPKDFNASITMRGMENNVNYRNGKAFNLSSVVTGNSNYETFYQWQLDRGDGWVDIHGQNTKDFKFTISPLDNGKKVRCSAVVIISNDSSYVLYTDPVEMNCARMDNDYEVDWEGNKIIIKKPDSSEKVKGIIRVCDSTGRIVNCIIVDGEADLSEYLGKGYDLRLFIWDNMAPETKPFER